MQRKNYNGIFVKKFGKVINNDVVNVINNVFIILDNHFYFNYSKVLMEKSQIDFV